MIHYDYTNLMRLILEKYGSIDNCAANWRGMSAAGLKARLNNEKCFRPGEIYKMQQLLDIPDNKINRYIFRRKDCRAALIEEIARMDETQTEAFLRFTVAYMERDTAAALNECNHYLTGKGLEPINTAEIMQPAI